MPNLFDDLLRPWDMGYKKLYKTQLGFLDN
jgi:hypothetical protein